MAGSARPSTPVPASTLRVWQTVPAQARAAPWDEALPPGPREVNIRELFKARARG